MIPTSQGGPKSGPALNVFKFNYWIRMKESAKESRRYCAWQLPAQTISTVAEFLISDLYQMHNDAHRHTRTHNLGYAFLLETENVLNQLPAHFPRLSSEGPDE